MTFADAEVSGDTIVTVLLIVLLVAAILAVVRHRW